MTRRGFPWGLLTAIASLAALAYLLGIRPLLRQRRAAADRYFSTRAGRAIAPAVEAQHTRPEVASLSRHLVDEIARAFGFPVNGWQRRLLQPIFLPIARSFASIALHFDETVGCCGLGPAFGDLLPFVARPIRSQGGDAIPTTGPLLIVSNHPGAYDVALIAVSLRRDDLKIISSTVPLLQELPNLYGHLIEVTREPSEGMRGVRQAIRHLRQGGALLVLPTGIVDPDPDVLPGAREALEAWSTSIELLLRAVPETCVVVAIVSGVLSPAWLHHPLVSIQPEVWRQRKLAEFLQIAQQILVPGSLLLAPRISFAPPVTVDELEALEEADDLCQGVVRRAQALLDAHMGQPARRHAP